MGNKHKRGEKKQKKVIPYTEAERNKKVMAIRFQLIDVNMDHVLTDEIRQNLSEFIKTGKEYKTVLELPEYSRQMEICFINDKNQQSFVNLKFIKIRIPGEGDNNPINQLNKIQEEII